MSFHVFGSKFEAFQGKMMDAIIIVKLCQDRQKLIDNANVLHFIFGGDTDKPMVIVGRLEHVSSIELDSLLQQMNLVSNGNLLLDLLP